MAASPVLADSSFYIRLMRAGRDPLRALQLAAASRDLAICGMVRCEVGRALLEPETVERYHSSWNVMVNVPTDNRMWDEIERVVWNLDRQGRVLPLADVVIACCALRIDATVLTFDNHFAQIPGVRVVNQLDF